MHTTPHTSDPAVVPHSAGASSAPRAGFNRKALAGVLALGVAALAADRFFFSAGLAPSEASAAPSDQTAVFSDQPATSDAPTPTGESLAARLRVAAETNLLDPTQVENAFTAPWAVPVPEPDEPEQAAPLPDAAAFVKSARVESIVHYPDSSVVVVSGERLVVGDSFRGWTLLTVEAKTLTFALQPAEGEPAADSAVLAVLQME